MRIVADTNILFSFFWKSSLTRRLILSSKFEIISPEIALNELEKYKELIVNKAKITKDNFNNLLKELKNKIEFIQKDSYISFIKEAINISPDKADTEFFALCIKNRCMLWSNDSLLKNQNKIKVLSTRDIIEILFD